MSGSLVQLKAVAESDKRYLTIDLGIWMCEVSSLSRCLFGTSGRA
jgi:hypothetical protein